MATRKTSNPELAAAAKNLAAAARHTRKAINQKIDQIGTAASGELNKARRTALTQSGRAKRQFDALVKSAQVRLKKITIEAREALHRAAGEAEKKLQAARSAVAKKVPAKKAASKKAAAKRAPARKVAVKRKAARKSAA